MIDWMRPRRNTKLIDVASGTGDLAKIFNKKTNSTCEIFCVEPNKDMLEMGKDKLKNTKILFGSLLQQKNYHLKMILLIFIL